MQQNARYFFRYFLRIANNVRNGETDNDKLLLWETNNDTSSLIQLTTNANGNLNAGMKKVKAFYDGAILLLRQPSIALAVFMLHQAIEHCFRGFLMGRKPVAGNEDSFRYLIEVNNEFGEVI